jgi:hypothetical protein
MARHNSVAAFGAVLALVAAASVGCGGGPRLVKAGGTVKYKNAPVPGADILMMSDASGPPSIARTDEQGRFTVTTDGKPGAPVGFFKVSITAARNKRPIAPEEAVAISSEQIAALREDLIPVKYNSFEGSGLTAEVTDDPAKNDFTFDLK